MASVASPSPRILIVEDERIIALHLSQTLTNLGFVVVASVVSGEEALERIKELEPDLVLMDIRLEGDLDGIETVQRLPPGTRSSIIYLTSHAEAATIERAKATKPHGYLLKPVPEQDLQITLTMVMERRAAEFALKENEERLRLALDAAEMGIWDIDLVKQIVLTAGRTSRIFGLPDEVLSFEWAQFLNRLSPDHKTALLQAFGDHRQAEAVRQVEFSLAEKPDDERWLSMRGRLFTGADHAQRMIGVVQDITERRRRDQAMEIQTEALRVEIKNRHVIELALRSSDEAFRDLFLNTPLPMWAIDHTTLRIISVNEAAVESYGYSRDEFLTMRANDLLTETSETSLKEQLDNISEGLLRWPNQTHRLKGGKTIQVDLFRRSLSFARKRAYLVVAMDVTERNAMEERLRQAQKMEAVGQLTGGLAHDFNNLLAVIYGNLELISESRSTSPDVAEMVQDALEAARRGARLTDHLLSIARQQRLSPEIVDITELISKLAQTLPRLLEASIKIEAIVQPNLGQTLLDRSQLENALINLAVNARDAMPDGGDVTIEAENTSLDEAYADEHNDVTAGEYVLIAVTDNGTGMTKEVLDRILDPFFTTKPVGRGTGLGLSMVHGFIKQSGGHLKIYSEPGHGTTVKLYLPRLIDTVETGKPQEKIAEPPLAKSKEVVLVVEDEASVRKLIIRLLTDLGYGTLEAGDGMAGLALFREAGQVDLLITDVVLPKGLSGPALARDARAHRPGLPVVFITGYAPRGVLKAEELENARIVSKPFSKSQLASAVREELDKAKQSVRPRRLLVIDDEIDFAQFVARVAKEMNYDVTVTTSGREFMAAHERVLPDVIVLDVIMPEQDGIELMQWLVSRHSGARILIITGGAPLYAKMAQEIGYRLGDFSPVILTKPVPSALLRAALE